MPRVLIVEDELRYAVNLMKALTEPSPLSSNVRLDVEITPDPKVASEHAKRDDIDIYIVDLKFKDEKITSGENPEIGRRLIKKILEKTNAGLIVHSSMPADQNAASFMTLGADDYIEKMSRAGGVKEVREGKRVRIEEQALHEIIKAKIIAVWRRVQLTRPSQFKGFAHAGRKFMVGNWQFTIGRRELVNDKAEKIRLSATEHALLRHLCVVQDHEIDIDTFNLEVLGRSPSERTKRIDNYIYRIRNRLGPSVQLVSSRDKKYKLITARELIE